MRFRNIVCGDRVVYLTFNQQLNEPHPYFTLHEHFYSLMSTHVYEEFQYFMHVHSTSNSNSKSKFSNQLTFTNDFYNFIHIYFAHSYFPFLQ